MTVMTDITELKQAERALAASEAQLHVALDNMPGALVYTDDDLTSSSATTASRRCTRRRRRCCSRASQYPDFLRYLAENGYYGEGDPVALVAQRVESLRNPTGRSFEDHAPDGRCTASCAGVSPAAARSP